MILLISTCYESFHEREFVEPIKKILESIGQEFIVKSYLNLLEEDLEHSEKIIICGTSLRDNRFLKSLKSFSWILNYNRPLLGVCAGMQIIGLVFGGKLHKKKEIGFYEENFKEEFLGLYGLQEVYHLHNSYVTFSRKNFILFSDSICPQAIKHKEKKIYGVLFHPEVRNKNLVRKFCKL